jgi:xylan 1,4-beta-xylosidase
VLTFSSCLFDPDLRPSDSSPGRTYKWYDQKPVLPFGYGLHYTTFSNFQWTAIPKKSYTISSIAGKGQNDATPFTTIKASVKNTGKRTSDYVGLLFISTKNAGPSPFPNKSLVSYTRAHDIAAGSSSTLSLDLTLGALARANKQGDLVIYPGDYTFSLDINAKLTFKMTLTGNPVTIEKLPRQAESYNYTVPVNPTVGNGPETC